MTGKKLSGIAIALLLGVTSCACLIDAHDEGVPIMITVPEGESMSCAVFFADNMVYAPQWRVDNYVRIEMMVLDTSEYASAEEILRTDTDLYPEVYVDGLTQQAALMSDSENVLPETKMVSVSYMEVTIRHTEQDVSFTFDAGWDPDSRAKVLGDGELGREVNKAGHLIYGMLWDTTGVPTGAYVVEVRLGKVVETFEGSGIWEPQLGEWYIVDFCIGHFYNPEGLEGELMDPEHPYTDLVLYEDESYDIYKNGAGGVGLGYAWVELGPLIPQGSGGGNGGDSGGNGNGSGNGGGGGNGNTWHGVRR